MGKADPFKDRPKLPNRDQIIADLETAPPNDVVFQDINQFIDESLQHRLASAGENPEAGGSTGKPDREAVNRNYQQVTHLLQLQEQLKTEPQLLSDKYNQLEKLGQDVSQSISELKSASEAVIKKS